MKNGFIIFNNSEEFVNILQDDELGVAIKKMVRYFKYREEPQDLTTAQKLLFLHIKEQDKYVVRKRKKGGKRKYKARKKEETEVTLSCM